MIDRCEPTWIRRIPQIKNTWPKGTNQWGVLGIYACQQI